MTKARTFLSLAILLAIYAAAGAQPEPRLKIIFHVDSASLNRLEMAFHNAQSAEMHVGKGNIKIVVVANGPAVKFFLKKNGAKTSDQIDKLTSTGDVEFHVCETSLKAFGYRPSDVLSTCKLVPAGVIDIAELESEGYAYIKP